MCVSKCGDSCLAQEGTEKSALLASSAPTPIPSSGLMFGLPNWEMTYCCGFGGYLLAVARNVCLKTGLLELWANKGERDRQDKDTNLQNSA